MNKIDHLPNCVKKNRKTDYLNIKTDEQFKNIGSLIIMMDHDNIDRYREKNWSKHKSKISTEFRSVEQ